MEGKYDVISLLCDTFESGYCGAIRLNVEKGSAKRGLLGEGSLALSLVESSERGLYWSHQKTSSRFYRPSSSARRPR
jgi:hypothetical protein